MSTTVSKPEPDAEQPDDRPTIRLEGFDAEDERRIRDRLAGMIRPDVIVSDGGDRDV